MGLELEVVRLASCALGVVALLRLGAIPDDHYRRGAWGKLAWAAFVVLGGMGTLVPFGPALALRRSSRSHDQPTVGQVPPIDLAEGVAPAGPALEPEAR